MTGLVDLNPTHLTIVEHILTKHVPGYEVRAFGSRATWNARDTSDLDLAVVGNGLLPNRTLTMLKEAFEESRLPIRVNVIDWNALTDGFRESINLDTVVVQGAAPSSPWPVVRLGDCITINEETVSSKDMWDYINYLDTGNITENRIDEIQHLVIGEDKVPTRARRKVRAGDIVYSTVRPNQRHYGLLKDIPENLLASTGFVVIRGKEGAIHTDFVYWLLAQDHIVDYLQAIAEHSTSAYPSIRPSDIEAIEFPLPPLEEQRRIACILGAFDSKIELNRRMSEMLEEMARALFKSWFVDFDPVRAKIEGRWRRGKSLPGLSADLYELFPDCLVDSDLGKIPEGWGVNLLGDVAEVVGGTTPSTKVKEYWEGGTHCWATPKDLSALSSPVLLDTERKVTDAGLQQIGSGLLPTGTLLLSSRAPIGYLAVSEEPVAINQGFIAMPPRKGTSNLFMLRWCRAFHDEIVSHANGSTFLEISKSNFRRIPLVVPVEAVMTTFDRLTRTLHDRIVSNERESRSLAVQRDALLPRLVSGDIKVRTE